jgi:hypothetical protein
MWFKPNRVRAKSKPADMIKNTFKYVSPKTDNEVEDWGRKRMALLKSMNETARRRSCNVKKG